MVSAVIYDMDDLMVNSDHLHATASDRLLREYGCDPSDMPKEMKANFIGKRVIDICEEVIDFFELDVDLETFYEQRTELFLDIVKNELEAMPGLVESLEMFKSSNDFKIGLASSGSMQYIDLVLDKFEIRKYFDVIVSGDCVSKGKPHPEIYQLASEKLNCKPQECVVFEDATNGIESAIKAGCKCVAIKNTNTLPQDCSKAHKQLNSLLEITIDQIKSL